MRGDAASLLGTIRDGSARASLELLLHDSHPGVREAAREALADLG
jgi:HEAT repeat protein